MSQCSDPISNPGGVIQPVPAVVSTRKDLSAWEQTPLKYARSWFTPDVILLCSGQKRLVLKDVRNRPLLFRLLWCRAAIAREVAAMRRLDPVPAVPKLITHLDADGFVMEWLDARPLPARCLAHELGTAFFQELDQAVREMHAHGVAHGDLRRRNILMTPDRRPRIIDFETAVLDGTGKLRHKAFTFASRVDHLTTLKIFGRYFPTDLDDSERQRLADAPFLLKAGRFLRKRVYRRISPKVMIPRLRNWRKVIFGR